MEFRETVNAGDIRKLNLWAQGNSSSFIQPYVNNPAGTWQLNPGTDEITYQFSAGGEASYGYKVTPAAGVLGSGYCNQDIGVFAMYSSFPFINLYSTDYTDVSLIFDVPEGMPVYSPWLKESERVIKLKDGGQFKQYYFLTAWGNFSHTETRKYGDHTFYMLAYNTDFENNFALTRFTYDYFMQAFAENIAFLPPANLHIVLPNNEGYIHPLGEGYGGSYMSNLVGDLEPIFRQQEYPCEGWCDYFRIMENGSPMTVQSVHCTAHATLNNVFPYDLWLYEGIAVYYQIKILEKIGILSSDQIKREFLSHLKCYQEVIVGSENDYPLLNFQPMRDNDYVTKMIGYIKGALAYYALNELINNFTDGKYELIDFFKSVFTSFNFSNDKSYDNLIRQINMLTGRDFNEFFERFIYSNEPLPLRIENDNIIMNYFPPDLNTCSSCVVLNAPTLSTPAGGVTGQATNCTITWLDTNSSHQENSYKVRIKPFGGSYTTYSAAQNAASYATSGLSSGVTYYWSVKAVGNGTSTMDSVYPTDRSFTVGAQPSEGPGVTRNAALYFPHIATSLPWQTEIAVINTSAQTVTGTLRGLSNGGQL
ncbi:MAG: hypothetical protein EHM85_17730, partial [Desulfobacteraceae bacterium]